MTEKYTLSVFRLPEARVSADVLSRVCSARFLQIFDFSFLLALHLPYVIEIRLLFCAESSSWS